MRSDTLLQATAEAFNWDYNELYALKYELDQHTYYYGRHYRNPRETSGNGTTAEQFKLNAVKIGKISEVLENNPFWTEHAVTSQTPAIVAFNYNYGNWSAALHREGYHIELPLWHGCQSDNSVAGLLHVLCALLKEMLSCDFKLLLSDEFKAAALTVKRILLQYYRHPRFKALFIPYALSYFEYLAVSVFRELGKPSFVFEHGIPSAYAFELTDIPDYTVVWGEQVKQHYLQTGVAAKRLIVAGHPTYHSLPSSGLRFDLDEVLVCTWSIIGAPPGNFACNQNRGYLQYYLYTIQSVLKKLGVSRARLRPHPSESCEWYERFVDTGFYRFDQAPLAQSLGSSSLVIGPASTVFIEAIYYGVDYLFYHPDEFEMDYKQWPPYNGEDPRIPVAKSPAQLEQYIREKRSIDPASFSDYMQVPFNPGVVIDKIRSHRPRRAGTAAPKPVLTERDLGKIPEDTRKIVEFVKPYTMTPPQRVVNVVKTIGYILDNDIPGVFVECGVWRGGCSMAAACELQIRGASERELYLYDTYEGMPPPTEHDVAIDNGVAAENLLSMQSRDKDSHIWAYAPFEDVVGNLARTGYPASRLHFVKGKVEETIPETLPDAIAVLRLDTDWYESTLHELVHLYPLLSRGGVLILDDYGTWAGSRKAVDEYLALLPEKIELTRIDDDFGSSAYYGIKP